jgi:hypothetical protein
MTETKLDLAQRHFTKVKNGLAFIGTWITMPYPEGVKPCLVIIRNGEEKHEATMPCVITSDKAHVWSITGMGDPREAARQASTFCEALRINTDLKSVIQLHMMIDDLLGDLLHIPPFPPKRDAPVIAEVTMTNQQTGEVKEVELKDA